MTTGRPYVWDVAGRAKWDAWNSHGAIQTGGCGEACSSRSMAKLSSTGSNDKDDAAEAQAA